MMYLINNFDNVEKANDIDRKVKIKNIKYIINKIITSISEETEQTKCNLFARILSDWGNVILSCDSKNKKCCACTETNACPPNTGSFDKGFLQEWWELTTQKEKDRYKKFAEYTTNHTSSKFETIITMYSLSSNFYKRSNLNKRSAFQLNKILLTFKHYLNSYDDNILYNFVWENNYLKLLIGKAVHSIYLAYDNINAYEINKRKKDLDSNNIFLTHLLQDSKVDRMKIIKKEIEFIHIKKLLRYPIINNKKISKHNYLFNFLMEFYNLTKENNKSRKVITSQYEINYSVSARIYRLRLKAELNYFILSYCLNINIKTEKNPSELTNKIQSDAPKLILSTIFESNDNLSIQEVLERTLADSIFCYKEMIKLSKTSGESYFFNHSFFGSTYKKLSEWTSFYEQYKQLLNEDNTLKKQSKIDKYLQEFLGREWREQLSVDHDHQQAMAHYHKTKETHSGGRAYYNIIDNLYYMKDDYNDRMSHFDIALERALISSGKIDLYLNELKKEQTESNPINPNYYDIDLYM